MTSFIIMKSNKSYHKLYKKYKKKYINLKQSLETNQLNNKCLYNYFFIHGSFRYSGFINILRDDIIYPGKYLKYEQRNFGASYASKFVFSNIYFEDIKNLVGPIQFSFILHPKILYENGFYFNEGWQGGPNNNSLHIKNTDTPIQIFNKLDTIRTFLSNPEKIGGVINKNVFMSHEILFDHPINLSGGTLLCIVCWNVTNEQLEEIHDAISDKSYKNIKILTKEYEFPKLEDMIY